MGDILYGAPMDESARMTRRSKGAGDRTFTNAAGYKQTVADLPEAAETDRHPHIQRAIRADAERRCTRDQIAHVAHVGLTPEDGAPEATVTGWHRGGDAVPMSAKPLDKADDLIYHPQHAPPSAIASPRRVRVARSDADVTATRGEEMIERVVFPDNHTPPGVAQHVTPSKGRKVWGLEPPGSAAAIHMPGVLAHAVDDATYAAYNSSVVASSGGVARVRVEPPPPKPHGKAAGVCNPGVGDGPAGGLTNAVSKATGWAPTQSRPSSGRGAPGMADAGVASSRLAELATNVNPIAITVYGAGTTVQEHQRAGAIEKRAGTGPRVPAEQRVTPHSRKAPDPRIIPQVRARNPVLGDGVEESDVVLTAAKRGHGRVHQSWDAMAAQHHLQGSTLVPEHEAAVPTGIATGQRATLPTQARSNRSRDRGRRRRRPWRPRRWRSPRSSRAGAPTPPG